MHLRQIRLQNIKSIRELVWDIPADKARGWHVVLGDNGSGKSTLLKAIAVALLGPHESYGLRQPWDHWLRAGCAVGEIELSLIGDPDIDLFAGEAPIPTPLPPLSAGLRLTQRDAKLIEFKPSADALSADRHVWGSEHGWFSASYGPFRRFTGGSRVEQPVSNTLLRLNRHLSLFGEDVALTAALDWLTWINTEGASQFQGIWRALLDPLKQFINQDGFLPAGVRLKEITATQVIFSDASGVSIPVQDLSDGYRSVLSMTFELIRQLALAFGPGEVFDRHNPSYVKAGGVVLIDEIDAHLHPTWQKRIGFWLHEHFPNIQFIVSTHSPLICQAAEQGSILLLPRSGSQDPPRRLNDTEFKRVVFGNVLDAYGTEAFGGEVAASRSPKAQTMRERLALLNTKEIVYGLNDAERIEQAALRATLPTSASSLE